MDSLACYAESSASDSDAEPDERDPEATTTTKTTQRPDEPPKKDQMLGQKYSCAGLADESEDDASADEASSAPQKEQTATKTGLPSAAALLAGENASAAWLKRAAWARPAAEEPATKFVTREGAQPTRSAQPHTNVEAQGEEYGDDMYEFYDPEKGWQHKQSVNFVDDGGGYRGTIASQRAPPAVRGGASPDAAAGSSSSSSSRHRSGEPASSARRKRESGGLPKNAKERVKQQRLAGQSGIGDDFRVWRSEEEMRLRQQFD